MQGRRFFHISVLAVLDDGIHFFADKVGNHTDDARAADSRHRQGQGIITAVDMEILTRIAGDDGGRFEVAAGFFDIYVSGQILL